MPQKGGIQMVIRMIGDDIAHARKANAAGLAVQALSDWRIRSSGEGGLLLSFTNIVNEGMARQVAQQLRKALRKPRSRGVKDAYLLSFVHYDLRMLNSAPIKYPPLPLYPHYTRVFHEQRIRAANGIARGLLDASTTMHSRPGFFQ